MQDFSIRKYVNGIAICPHCDLQCKVQIHYGEFVNLRCLNCGTFISEIHNPQITGVSL